MKMGHCKDCVHWKEPESRPYNAVPGYRQCELTRFDGEDDYSKALATARDASGYCAVLYTSPKFGCVEFSPKAS